jgi:HSP20 family protein
MAKQTRRRRNAQPKHPEQRHAQAATLARTETAMPATNLFEPMERLMQAFMPMTWMRPWTMEPHTPKLDVIDRDDALLVRAEVPGVDKSHLAVEASDLAVTIRGEVRDEVHDGTFERTIRLPSDVDSGKAKATFKDGVLEVMLPKVDRSRPHSLKL